MRLETWTAGLQSDNSMDRLCVACDVLAPGCCAQRKEILRCSLVYGQIYRGLYGNGQILRPDYAGQKWSNPPP